MNSKEILKLKSERRLLVNRFNSIDNFILASSNLSLKQHAELTAKQCEIQSEIRAIDNLTRAKNWNKQNER